MSSFYLDRKKNNWQSIIMFYVKSYENFLLLFVNNLAKWYFLWII